MRYNETVRLISGSSRGLPGGRPPTSGNAEAFRRTHRDGGRLFHTTRRVRRMRVLPPRGQAAVPSAGYGTQLQIGCRDRLPPDSRPADHRAHSGTRTSRLSERIGRLNDISHAHPSRRRIPHARLRPHRHETRHDWCQGEACSPDQAPDDQDSGRLENNQPMGSGVPRSINEGSDRQRNPAQRIGSIVPRRGDPGSERMVKQQQRVTRL
jgi:hypothetical protein